MGVSEGENELCAPISQPAPQSLLETKVDNSEVWRALGINNQKLHHYCLASGRSLRQMWCVQNKHKPIVLRCEGRREVWSTSRRSGNAVWTSLPWSDLPSAWTHCPWHQYTSSISGVETDTCTRVHTYTHTHTMGGARLNCSLPVHWQRISICDYICAHANMCRLLPGKNKTRAWPTSITPSTKILLAHTGSCSIKLNCYP